MVRSGGFSFIFGEDVIRETEDVPVDAPGHVSEVDFRFHHREGGQCDADPVASRVGAKHAPYGVTEHAFDFGDRIGPAVRLSSLR